MRFRPVILLTLWTVLIGPVLAVPTAWNSSQSRGALKPIHPIEMDKDIHITPLNARR